MQTIFRIRYNTKDGDTIELRLLDFENNIKFSDEYVSVLEVENKHLFLSIISSLLAEEGEEQKEQFVLIEGDKEIKISKYIIVITDVLCLDINNKKILSLAIDKLEKICQNDEHLMQEIVEANIILSSKVISLINELESYFSISTQWDLSRYLKAFNFEINKNSITNPFDKVMQYIQIVSELLNGCIICFVNLKSIFTDEQIYEIYKFAIYNKVKLFLIESTLSSNKLEYEHKLIIDREFDEFNV